eukprot:CFRG0526T1
MSSFPLPLGASPSTPTPAAEERPHDITQFGQTRNDEYNWMRSDERNNKQVIAHLEEENEYTKSCLEDQTVTLRTELYEDMKSRVKEDDQQPAARIDDWYYYTREEEGKQYSIHCRRRAPSDRTGQPPTITETIDVNEVEEILLDENERGGTLTYYRLTECQISPDHKTMAIAEDTNGSEKYTLRFLDLTNGAKDIEGHVIENCSGDVVWGTNSIVFYLTKDGLDRPDRLWRYDLDSPSYESVEVFHESDDQHYLGLSRSRSDKYVYILSDSTITSEVLYIPVADPTAQARVILPRKKGHEYHVVDREGVFYLLSNENALNQKLLCAPVEDISVWTEILPHREDTKLERIRTFKNHVILTVRQNGLRQFVVYQLNESLDEDHLGDSHLISFEEPAYSLSGGSGQYQYTVMRFSYSSLCTPSTVYDVDLNTRDRAVKKIQVVPGYDASLYKTERHWATAEDGVLVPISLVYRPSATTNEANPLYLEAYGAYEISCDAYFSSPRVSLLDRGVVYAIAHVRGGGEMGRNWYEDGKLMKKHNTWRDYQNCVKYLINTNVTAKGRIIAEGCSAGGLNIGATLNEIDEGILAGAICRVGFVDVLTTMSDPSIPLTSIEWDEWGNCMCDEEYFKYMGSYSPYDNIVINKEYPPILATAGLNDNRVGYWEPCKWIQRLRKADKNHGVNMLYRCLMESGHFAKSGRFQMLEEKSLMYAFVLKCLFLA